MANNAAGGGEFKPNMYPIMYWGLVFGVSAGLLLFAVFLLSRFIVYIWFPVFLAGLLWGGYRNYQQQKRAWQQDAGSLASAGTALQELKAAARDMVSATQQLMRENAPADEAAEASREEKSEGPPPVSPQVPTT